MSTATNGPYGPDDIRPGRTMDLRPAGLWGRRRSLLLAVRRRDSLPSGVLRVLGRWSWDCLLLQGAVVKRVVLTVTYDERLFCDLVESLCP